MLTNVMTTLRSRAAALRSDERGMEAAQVILILAVVVIVLIPVIGLITDAVSAQGSKVVSGINGIR